MRKPGRAGAPRSRNAEPEAAPALAEQEEERMLPCEYLGKGAALRDLLGKGSISLPSPPLPPLPPPPLSLLVTPGHLASACTAVSEEVPALSPVCSLLLPWVGQAAAEMAGSG